MIYNRNDDESHRLVDAITNKMFLKFEKSKLKGKVDRKLQIFRDQMKVELDENFYKGDREVWSKWSLDEAMSEVTHHVEKLQNALDMRDNDSILEHTADVANCVMILADVAGVLQPVAHVEPPPPQTVTNVVDPGYVYGTS